MRIAIATAQIPFVTGGAEQLTANLRDAIVARGDEADVVALPFKWYPAAEIPKQVLMARLVDLAPGVGSGEPEDQEERKQHGAAHHGPPHHRTTGCAPAALGGGRIRTRSST